jgi:hypothetical protein
MTTDAYWDELGIAWKAAETDVTALTPSLKANIRRQSLLIAVGGVGAATLSLAGFVIGPLTIWIGVTGGTWHFVVRGIAILVVAAMLAASARALSSVRATDNALALPDMIDLSIGRAVRMLRVIRLALLSCAIAGILGMVGAAIRSSISRPPAMSPLVDLALLALLAIGLALYRRGVRADLAKFEYLRRVLAEASEKV